MAMTSELLLDLAERVRAACAGAQDRDRRELERLDAKIAEGHTHLKPVVARMRGVA